MSTTTKRLSVIIRLSASRCLDWDPLMESGGGIAEQVERVMRALQQDEDLMINPSLQSLTNKRDQITDWHIMHLWESREGREYLPEQVWSSDPTVWEAVSAWRLADGPPVAYYSHYQRR